MLKRGIVALVIAPLLLGQAAQESLQQPPPGNGVSSQPQQPHAQPADDYSTPNQYRAPPPPIIVNVHAPPKSEAEAEDERRERKEKAELDRRLVDLTGELAWFTAGLFAATVALVLATGVLGFFGWRQSRDTRESIQLAGQAAENARRELVLTQRPKLRVRNIVVEDQRPHRERFPLFMENKTVRGRLTVVNVGGTPDQIVDSLCIVYWSPEGLPLESPYEGRAGNGAFPLETLAAGQATRGTFESEEVMNDRGQTVGTEIVGGLHLYVMGWVNYRDDIGIRRRTTFCREYERRGGFAHGRFGPVADPDYEHED